MMHMGQLYSMMNLMQLLLVKETEPVAVEINEIRDSKGMSLRYCCC